MSVYTFEKVTGYWGLSNGNFSLLPTSLSPCYLAKISSTTIPGDIQRLVSEGRSQPVALPSLTDPAPLTPPGLGKYKIVG